MVCLILHYCQESLIIWKTRRSSSKSTLGKIQSQLKNYTKPMALRELWVLRRTTLMYRASVCRKILPTILSLPIILEILERNSCKEKMMTACINRIFGVVNPIFTPTKMIQNKGSSLLVLISWRTTQCSRYILLNLKTEITIWVTSISLAIFRPDILRW